MVGDAADTADSEIASGVGISLPPLAEATREAEEPATENGA
jgi:hypothetical protein